MIRASSPRERRLIALFILVACVALVWLTIIAPIISGFSERAAERTALLQRYQVNQRTIASIPRLRRQAEQQRETLRSFAVIAPTSAAAGAQIEERLQRVIETAGGELRNLEDVSTTARQVRVLASARLSLGQVGAVLTRLQNETPFLNIETLNISADQAAISGRMETMEVSFEISVPIILAKPR